MIYIRVENFCIRISHRNSLAGIGKMCMEGRYPHQHYITLATLENLPAEQLHIVIKIILYDNHLKYLIK